MNRRTFFQHAGAASIAAGFPGVLLASSAPQWHALAAPDVLTIIDDRREVIEIGRAYRLMYADQDTPEHIASMIQTPRSTLAEQIRSEFGEGQTIQLKGWMLSLTEARQCALYSFLNT